MFSALKRVRAYEQIADEVRERILKGLLRPGEKLPGERELAGQFGVNRSTVREALKSLSELGLVVVRHGGGAVVQDYAARAGLQILPYLFPRDGSGSLELMASLLESRRIFTVETTRLGVERAISGEQLTLARIVGELEKLADELVALGDDDDARRDELLERFQSLDFDFVDCLARASRNAILVLVMNSVRPVYEQQRALFRSLYDDPRAIAAAYRKIVANFDAREADRAARIMETVMRNQERHVTEILGALADASEEPHDDARPAAGRARPRSTRSTHRRR
ncbi:GntR family transcriptional regulator [Myxococcota bacterium]|nr:GntR family transcriptional regulator [Myxococcota bacterium]